MKIYHLLPLCLLPAIRVAAQSNAASDSTAFILHKLENPVGKEKCYVVKKNNETIYHIEFKLSGKGIKPLDAEFILNASDQPVSLKVKGNTSPFDRINDTIAIRKDSAFVKADDTSFCKKLTGLNFPVTGYAPGTIQQLLLRYWIKHHQPYAINTLPDGKVKIRKDGMDAFKLGTRLIKLDRYLVNGVVWGNEIIWADRNGKIAGLLTTNESADKFEMVSPEYEGLLPAMVHKSAVYGLTALKLPDTEDRNLIAVTGGTLVDVVTGATTAHSVILLKNGKIISIGKTGQLAIPAHARIINAKGKTIMPGLWDMHAHYAQAEWGPAFLAAGITTVRDCTNEFDYITPLKNRIDDGKGIGPLILKAGLIDGKGPDGMGVVQVDTKDAAIAAVDLFKANGYVQIKVFSSLKPEMVKVVCAEAHRVGLTVTGHIPDGMNLKQAVDSGMDMVNHIHYAYSIMKHLKGGAVNFDDSVSRSAVRFMQQHQVVIDATVNSLERVFRPLNMDMHNIEPAFSSLPEPLQIRLKGVGMDTALAKRYGPMYSSVVKMVKVLYDAGVPIIAGSDQGFPGYSLDRELEIYVRAGLTPLEAIQCATITPAKVMKMDTRAGSIAIGKNADILIVNGNPLQNISDLRKVALVIKGTRIYHPTVLRRLVGFSK